MLKSLFLVTRGKLTMVTEKKKTTNKGKLKEYNVLNLWALVWIAKFTEMASKVSWILF